ncbi:MAG TPA: hypothetical protein VK837_13920 [Longimicrobiales bacterium]|nr:hypothetical protein [Longimicrobiales bacterium]
MAVNQGLSGSLSGGKTVEELAREFEDIVVDRLKRVERSNRRLHLMGGVILILLVLALGAAAFYFFQLRSGGMPAWAASTVTAREFQLSDASGAVRGVWRAEDDGSARLSLMDTDGNVRIRLSVLDQGGSPGIAFLDQEGAQRIVLAHLPDVSNLAFADEDGRARAVLGVAADRSATLGFADRRGLTRALIGVDRFGDPDLAVMEGGAGSGAVAAPAESDDGEGEGDEGEGDEADS